MDCIREYFECINFHWIVIVFTGLYIHLRQICLIGLCFEVTKEVPFDSSYASLIFIFSALSLIAEYRLWPRSLKEPPIQLLIIYEMLVSALVTDLVTRIIWIPLMHITLCLTQESGKMLIWLNTQLELDKYSILISAASYMGTEVAAVHTAFCISVLTFLWMLDATETLDSILIDLMTKLIYTIWALVLNCMGISVFKTCFVDAMEDEYGDNFLTGPPITSFIFALGVYTILTNLNLYPASFRKPISILIAAYEFLVTSFLLDFSMACIWTPIDIHIYITLTNMLRRVFLCFGMNDAATWILYNKFPMTILCFIICSGFFLITLHVTKSVDFTIYTDYGICCFISYLKNKLIKKISSELPRLCNVQCIGCKSHKRNRGQKRSRRNVNHDYEND